MTSGIIEIDVHGMNVEEAIKAIRLELSKPTNSVYRIRVIHGYHGGTKIRNAIRDEFYYGVDSKVKNVKNGDNPGITELILREY